MKKLKTFSLLLANYAVVIGFAVGLRALHGLESDVKYYVIISSVIVALLIVFTFLEPKHLSKILPRNSRAVLILSLILRFIPLTKRKILSIKQAQEMRGANFGKLGQFKNYLSLFIPAIVNIIRWSETLGEHLQMRGEK